MLLHYSTTSDRCVQEISFIFSTVRAGKSPAQQKQLTIKGACLYYCKNRALLNNSVVSAKKSYCCECNAQRKAPYCICTCICIYIDSCWQQRNGFCSVCRPAGMGGGIYNESSEWSTVACEIATENRIVGLATPRALLRIRSRWYFSAVVCDKRRVDRPTD